MNYKLCELYNVYTILSNYEQNTQFIQTAHCFLCSLHFFRMLQVRENEISLRNSSGGHEYLCTLEGTLLMMKCKWTFTQRYILSTLQRKCPMLLTATTSKNALLAAIARYISITTFDTVRYPVPSPRGLIPLKKTSSTPKVKHETLNISNICKATTLTRTKRIDRNLLRKKTSLVCYTSSVL